MRKFNYCKCAVICHGFSERQIAAYIKSNLHLKLEILSKSKGHYSIQITSVINYLRQFKSLKSFANDYGVEYKKGKLLNFKLFIIMDTDDCTENQRICFMDKSMFKGHFLYEYICPIYNSPKLEMVLCEAKIMHKIIKDDEKGEYYIRTFPINNEPYSLNSCKEIENLMQKITPVNSTNMDEFIKYCLDLLR